MLFEGMPDREWKEGEKRVRAYTNWQTVCKLSAFLYMSSCFEGMPDQPKWKEGEKRVRWTTGNWVGDRPLSALHRHMSMLAWQCALKVCAGAVLPLPCFESDSLH